MTAIYAAGSALAAIIAITAMYAARRPETAWSGDGRSLPVLRPRISGNETFFCEHCTGDGKRAARAACTCASACGSESCQPRDNSESGWDTETWAAELPAAPAPVMTTAWSWDGSTWTAPEAALAFLDEDDWLRQLLTSPLPSRRSRKRRRRGAAATA